MQDFKMKAEEICRAAARQKKVDSEFFGFMKETIEVALRNAYDDGAHRAQVAIDRQFAGVEL